MRLEIDEGLAKLLAKIKDKEPSIYGRGHAETVRFLATYYEHHKSLEELLAAIRHSSAGFIDNLDVNLQMSLERVFPKAVGRAIANLLAAEPREVRSTDAEKPQRSGDPAAGQPKEGR